jgi:hypothetical protein
VRQILRPSLMSQRRSFSKINRLSWQNIGKTSKRVYRLTFAALDSRGCRVIMTREDFFHRATSSVSYGALRSREATNGSSLTTASLQIIARISAGRSWSRFKRDLCTSRTTSSLPPLWLTAQHLSVHPAPLPCRKMRYAYSCPWLTRSVVVGGDNVYGVGGG